MNIDRRDKSFALFAQEERKLSDRWKLDLGLRFDFPLIARAFFRPGRL